MKRKFIDMKRVFLLVLLALSPLSAAAQTPEECNFSVKDNYVTWQLVYEDSVDAATVMDYLRGSGNFADIADVSSGISFTITPRTADWRSSGVQKGYVPMYILNHQMTAHGLLQIRDGRYRVTVDHIIFLDDPSPIPLETYALNRQRGFKGVFYASTSNAAAVLNSEFTGLFKIPEQAEEEEW